jgi:hypothetical protein
MFSIYSPGIISSQNYFLYETIDSDEKATARRNHRQFLVFFFHFSCRLTSQCKLEDPVQANRENGTLEAHETVSRMGLKVANFCGEPAPNTQLLRFKNHKRTVVIRVSAYHMKWRSKAAMITIHLRYIDPCATPDIVINSCQRITSSEADRTFAHRFRQEVLD